MNFLESIQQMKAGLSSLFKELNQESSRNLPNKEQIEGADQSNIFSQLNKGIIKNSRNFE